MLLEVIRLSPDGLARHLHHAAAEGAAQSGPRGRRIRDFRPGDADGVGRRSPPRPIEASAAAFISTRTSPTIALTRFTSSGRDMSVGQTMADTILVSEGTDGQLLGFLAFRRREPVSSVGGVPVFGGGLGACRLDMPGAYAGLIRAGTVWAHERDGVAECQTQNYNFPTIRIYEAVGAHYVRAEYTLHLSLATP